MAAKAMRKMQVPAYCPVEVGVHVIEKSGVVVDEKKVMAIELIPIIVVVSISIEPEVALAVAMGMVIDMLPMSLVTVVIDIESISRRCGG